jgi:hypothetical protein
MNILTASEAAMVLRTSELDQNMLDLLPQIDVFIRGATGHDFAGDATILPQAKSAARMLLVKWYEDPGMMANSTSSLNFGLTSMMCQLEAWAHRYRRFQGATGAGKIDLPGACMGDTVSSLVGKIGISGDQSANFEHVISVDDQIQQVSGTNLTGKWYEAYLVPVEGL